MKTEQFTKRLRDIKMPITKRSIKYHFDLVFDEATREWELIEDFEGIPLQPIEEDGKWRGPYTNQEMIKLTKRRDELREVLKALSGGAGSPRPDLSVIDRLRF
jgi:hypothetical protein